MSTVVADFPELRTVTLDEYDRIVELEAANGMSSLRPDDWRNLWLANPIYPRVAHDWPIGWIMENAAGRVVGSLYNVPSLYSFRGADLICANGRGWVVDANYRAFALALMGEYFGQTQCDVFINTTVGPTAAPLISTLSDPIPHGDFTRTAYFATRYVELAAKKLRRLKVPGAALAAHPVAALLRLKDAWRLRPLRQAARSIVVEAATTFDARFDAFWQEYVQENPHKLLAARDSRAMTWHYAASLRRGDLWIYTASRAGLLRGYAVFKVQDPGLGVSRMRMVDYQTLDPQDDLLPGFLDVALRRCHATGIHVLEQLGCDLPKSATFERFAPYRRELPCRPFYYRAVDPQLDAELANPDVWEPSPYDGDASFD